jgi:hypothetical protein
MYYDDWNKLSYDELVRENYYLRTELAELKRIHSDFINRTVNGTTNVTNEWVKLLVSGELKI